MQADVRVCAQADVRIGVRVRRVEVSLISVHMLRLQFFVSHFRCEVNVSGELVHKEAMLDMGLIKCPVSSSSLIDGM